MSDQTDHETSKIVTNISDVFGAKMEVGIQLRAETTALEFAKARARVKQQVRLCTKCGLHGQCTGPVPMDVPNPTRVLVIGEAPGQVEDKRGMPFVGPAGKLMRAMMDKAGFELDEVGWANVVSCWPGRQPPTPTREEQVACRGNLRDQVVASGVTYVVLAGGIATQAWRGDLKVSDVHGRVFLWGGMWIVMPVYHPAAILRDTTKKQPTIRDLERFARVVREDQGLGALETRCVKCGEPVEHYDPDGVGWCGRHWLRYGAQWKIEMAKWSNERVKVKVKRGPGKRDTVMCDGQQQF